MTLALSLIPLALLRVIAAAAEVVLASGPELRRGTWLGDRVLASAARACVQVAGALAVGVIVTLVWRHAGRGWIPPVIALAAPAMLVLLDLVPRGLAVEAPARLRRGIGYVFAGVAVALAPLLVAERLLGRLFGRGAGAPLLGLRRLGVWLAARPGRGPLDVSEAGLVVRIAGFAGKTALDVMVPHVDVCAVPDSASVGDVVALVQARGFSRLPVFHERMFNTIGIVSSLDLLGVVDPTLP